jgi:low affinity Fe/Cu permease
MLENGIDMFEQHAEAIALDSLTKKSYEAIRDDIEKRAEIERVRKEGDQE